MFDTSGAFGQVRLLSAPLYSWSETNFHTPYHLNNSGWHRCNSLYRIDRPCGKTGHLLLFSISDGGMLQLEQQPPISIPASCVVWLPAGCGHSYYTRQGGMWEFYWLDVSEKDELPFADIFEDAFIFPITNIRAISTEIEKMLRKQFADRQQFLIQSSRMIGNIYHMLLEEQAAHGQKQDIIISEIIRDMELFYQQDWNLADLSKKYYISVPQLIRRFKSATGMPPYTYLTTIRLNTAGLYLLHTNWTIHEISQKVGFSCVSSFIRQFRALYGITPKNYRTSCSGRR